MKKIFNYGVMMVVVMTLCVGVSSCGQDDDGSKNDGNKSKNNSEEIVKDPEGTITANISEDTRIYISDCKGCNIGWTKPNNFLLLAQNEGYFGYYISICNVGSVAGLGSITKISTSGFTNPVGHKNTEVACEKGYGYIVKCENPELGKTAYVRMYVVEKIVSTSGAIIGAKVKYQYPFEP